MEGAVQHSELSQLLVLNLIMQRVLRRAGLEGGAGLQDVTDVLIRLINNNNGISVKYYTVMVNTRRDLA